MKVWDAYNQAKTELFFNVEQYVFTVGFMFKSVGLEFETKD